jgi:serine/threonine protein kinase
VVHDKLEFGHVYEELDSIGQGGHAVVKRCRKRGEEMEYAVKIFRSGDPEIINTIKKTFQNNLKLQHENICQAYELFIDERSEQSYYV